MTSMTNLHGTTDSGSSTMTNPSSSTSCHQQGVVSSQQDLLRLLAQHFNQADGHANQHSRANLGGATNSTDIDLLHQSIAHLQQQQQQHHSVNPNAVNLPLMNDKVDLAAAAAAACLMGTNSNNQISLSGQLSRSHNQAPITSMPSSIINPSIANDSPGAPTIGTARVEPQHGQVGAHLGNPFLTDMNLFNALNCFNMNNEQLMLSLQQQYLIQMASAANRQYEFKHRNLNTSLSLDAMHSFHNQQQHQHQNHLSQLVQHQASVLQQQQQQQQQQQDQQDAHTSQRGRKHQADQAATRKGVELMNSHSDDGRELLKFSISTILGRGSPVPGGHAHAEPCSIPDQINALTNQKSTESQSGQRRRTHASSPECDPNVLTDLSSDSSSPNTPMPQSNSQFNQCQTRNTPSAELNARASSLVDQVARYQQANTEQQRSALANQQHPATLTFLAGSAPFPWTSTARGKPRRGMMRRAVFSDSQRVGLEKRFQLQKYISKPDRKKLAEKLGLRDSQVKIWFQNRRMKWRNSKERELLSTGGSREQTLPTRNNPNPDLSDVGETIKRLSSASNSNAGT